MTQSWSPQVAWRQLSTRDRDEKGREGREETGEKGARPPETRSEAHTFLSPRPHGTNAWISSLSLSLSEEQDGINQKQAEFVRFEASMMVCVKSVVANLSRENTGFITLVSSSSSSITAV